MTEISKELVERMAAFVRECERLTGDYRTFVGGADSDDEERLANDARAIVAELPAPVDPDLVEARKWAAETFPDVASTNFIDGKADGGSAIQWHLAGIKRGRELSLAETGK